MIELNWKYRETQDSEFADAKYKCFAIQVQDCDGDMSRWHIKRGDQYIAVGEERSVGDVYHMDHAIATAVMVLGYLVKAVDLNDFVKNELPRIEDGTHPFCFDTRKRRPQSDQVICPDCRGERRGADGGLCKRCGGSAQFDRSELRPGEVAPWEG